MAYIPPPHRLDGFPAAQKTRPKTSMGRGLKRKRWMDQEHIYEWDYQHGRVEKYDLKGKHIGEFDPTTGEFVSGADKTRSIEP